MPPETAGGPLSVAAEPSTLTMKSVADGPLSSSSGSLKVRTMLAPSLAVAARDRVGRTPSTRCAASAGTAAWVSTAPMALSVEAEIVPPSRVSRFAPMAMPSASASSSATW